MARRSDYDALLAMLAKTPRAVHERIGVRGDTYRSLAVRFPDESTIRFVFDAKGTLIDVERKDF